MDKTTLEWAAQWIEDSLKGETDKRVTEFGKNMAMTLRAAMLDTRAPTTGDAVSREAVLAAIDNEECLATTEAGKAYNEALADATWAVRRLPALPGGVDAMKVARLIQDAVNDDPRMLDDQVALAAIIAAGDETAGEG